MEALNQLLKAQADVKKREVSAQQAGNGSGNNNRNYDMSALFDKELQKQQQTNYETRSSAEQREDPNKSALDKITRPGTPAGRTVETAAGTRAQRDR